MTPLWIIALFVGLTETVCGFAVTKTSDSVQTWLAMFVITYPVFVAAVFFALLWFRPWQLYSPHDFTTVKVDAFVKALRGVTNKTERIERKIDSLQEEHRLSRQLLGAKSDELWRRQLNVAMMVHGGMVRFSYLASKPESEAQLCEGMSKYLLNAAHMNFLLPKAICDAIAKVSQAAMDATDAFCEGGSVPEAQLTALNASIRTYEESVRRHLNIDAIDMNTGLSASHVESLAMGVQKKP